MVFVHSRKETVKTAEMLYQRAQEEQLTEFFAPQEHPQYELFKREMASSRNREMKDLFSKGFGCVLCLSPMPHRPPITELVCLCEQDPPCWHAANGPNHLRAHVRAGFDQSAVLYRHSGLGRQLTG